MQVIIGDPNLISLLIFSLVLFLVLQIYLIYKIKVTIQRILDIFLKLDRMVQYIQFNRTSGKTKPDHNCQNCKNRIVYFHSDKEPYFYIKCRLSDEIVSPEDSCYHFILDPQSYEI